MRRLIAGGAGRSPTTCAPPAASTSTRSAPTSTRSVSPSICAPRLVRGLDYYTRTAFEFYQRGAEGQQSALGGGGRYDGLLELFGGAADAGHRLRAGLDRIVLALGGGGRAAATGRHPVAVVGRRRPGGHRHAPAHRDRAARGGHRRARRPGRRKLARQLEGAARDGAHFAVIVGDELRPARCSCATRTSGPWRARTWYVSCSAHRRRYPASAGRRAARPGRRTDRRRRAPTAGPRARRVDLERGPRVVVEAADEARLEPYGDAERIEMRADASKCSRHGVAQGR